MFKKILLLAILVACTSGFLFSGPRYTKEELAILSKFCVNVRMAGETVKIDVINKIHGIKNLQFGYSGVMNSGPYKYTPDNPNNFITSVTFTETGGRGCYDYQANGIPVEIWQDPARLDNIHVVHMFSDITDPTFTNRRTNYYFSTDRGITWSFINQVPNNSTRTGYCAIDGTSDGSALISYHGPGPLTTTTHFMAAADAFPGLGSFSELDPNLIYGFACQWPRIVATNSISLTNKFVLIGAHPTPDTCYSVTGTSLSASTFLSPFRFPFTNFSAESYAIARGSNGNVGIAFKGANNNVYFLESTNNGTSFGSPIIINTPNYSTDSLVCAQGISLCYSGTVPKITFNAAVYMPDGSGYFPNAYSNCIKFWSTNLPGTDPNRCIKVSTTNQIGNHMAFSSPTADIFDNMCKPVIGVSATGSGVFIAFMVPSDFIYAGNNDSCSYMRVYLTASGDNGLSWKAPEAITPIVPTAMRDYTFPSMSKVNDNTASNYYVNLVMVKDSVAGTFLYSLNGPSNVQQEFVRVTIAAPIFVENITNEIPGSFALMQNYPNPFNPVSAIRFALPKTEVVTLKIYNSTGQLIQTLINNETVSAGIREVKFSGTNLASGIYFYTIQAGSFTDTKKMMLIK